MTEASTWAAFVAALGPFGGSVRATASVTAMVDDALRNGWTVADLAAECIPRGNAVLVSPGAVLTERLRSASQRQPPAPAPPRPAARGPERFTQPLSPCGQCDGTPARWADVHDDAGAVIGLRHCPRCWTAPPGYVEPEHADAGPPPPPRPGRRAWIREHFPRARQR